MSLIQKLEHALPLIKKAASFHPVVNEALKVAERIVGPQQDWSKNSGKAVSNLLDYCNENNLRISNALDHLRIGTKSRNLLDSTLPGLADTAEKEIIKLAEKQSKDLTREKYRIFPVNKR